MKKQVFLALAALAGFMCQKAEDYKITSLPGIDINTLGFSQYAGHIEMSTKSNANMFFWMLEQEDKTTTEKTIIWFNGGPGCSSLDGLFLENGPFRVQKNLSLQISEGGWQNYATAIYVDQPVGTGFSFVDSDSYITSVPEAADMFLEFLDKLYMLFPHLKQQPLYLAGESYAGTYIPYFATHMLKANKEKKKEYNIKGIAIGNGWISPKHQYDAYFEYSFQQGLIPNDRLDYVQRNYENCREDMKRLDSIHIQSCERVLTDVIDASVKEDSEGNKVCINVYDIRLKEENYPDCGLSWPAELSDMTKYLRLPEVKKAIHAEKQALGWKECTASISVALDNDISRPSYSLLSPLLEEISVLLYSGEYDLICNTLGTEYLVGNLTWNGSKGFNSPKEEWRVDGKLSGYYTQSRNLTYVLIKDGTHMVPYDKPIECLDMINRFIGSGGDVVKGRPSQVGKGHKVTKPEDKKPEDKKPEGEKPQDKKPDTEKEEDEHKKLPKYYGWFLGAFALSILGSLLLCCYCFTKTRRVSPTAEFGGARRQLRQDTQKATLLNKIQGWFTSNSLQKRKLRLGDRDDENELDELVVENPTLFEADEDFDEELRLHSNNQPAHFTIDDANDDEYESDFEDFANWDDDSNLKLNKRR
ncbi:serine carboxypeptidase-domain-containing protein [Sporodiniella umbellata]|nr:serine carboxypeptidase-domain-containing protein [Sporodiniella umbellata]